MPLGIYISVPFCKSKCSYCNFASGVFSVDRMQGFVDRVCADIADAERLAMQYGAHLNPEVDTIYLGGGTPSTLAAAQLEQLFVAVRRHFDVSQTAEITLECAPGTLSSEMLSSFNRIGVNRVSLGIQSFIDQEARAVGRLHTRETTLTDISRLREAGITNINIDLIAGLPHQTAASWDESLNMAIETGTPHVSVYMLEIDEDSRLGRELIAGGTRYHAHHVPDEDLTADMYQFACARLAKSGINQYEISNFARPGFESHHNLKYWTRLPYFGFGLDAHSMLPSQSHHPESELTTDVVRFSTTDDLQTFLVAPAHTSTCVSRQEAMEEEFFLGLRQNRGIDLTEIEKRHQAAIPKHHVETTKELLHSGLLEQFEGRLKLTERGRLLSNEVFQQFITNKVSSF
jgi:oxygen-independent coproporphyrinogen-3 oxidase